MPPNANSQVSEAADEDVDMVGANDEAAKGEEKEEEKADGAGPKSEVKLEDLFPDDESDDEFSSSKQEVVASSPPQDPASPM